MYSLLNIHFQLFVPLFILLLVCDIWGIADTYRLIRYEGKIKRGIRLFQKPMPEDIQLFLQTLSANVRVKREASIGEIVGRIAVAGEVTLGFIRVDGNERLIYARKNGWSTQWPYVVYANLGQLVPMLEYRVSLPMNLVFVWLFLLTAPIPFVWLLLCGVIYWNYRMETKAIQEFLQRQQIQRQPGVVL